MRFALASIGFTTTIAQLVLMREFIATFYGNELLFGIVLMTWLAWVAAGAWGLSRWAIRQQLGVSRFVAGLVLAGILLPIQLTSVRGIRALLGVTPGALVEFGPMLGMIVLILAPLCLLEGFLFTFGARLFIERGETAGRAYLWESLGAIFGGALFSFLFIRWLDPYQTLLVVSAANLAVAASLWLSNSSPDHNPRRVAYFVFAIFVVIALPVGQGLHQATLRWQWKDLLYAADSPYGRLTIQARDSQRAFFENGWLAFETQGTYPEEVVHFPMLAHPAPRAVLLIGGGIAGDLGEILKHPIDSVTYVELDPLLIEAARAYLPAQEAAILDDRRVRLVLTDGRLYVKENAQTLGRVAPEGVGENKTVQTYDVVILDMPEPATGSLNRFYTREFFAEVHSILNPGGILEIGLPSAENYWSPELRRRNASIYRTLLAAFPNVLVLPGEHNFFLASDTPLEADPNVLASRLVERSVNTRWVTPEYLRYILTTDRFAEVRQELEATTGVRINQDMAPICYYYNLALWFSRFYPNLHGAFEHTSLFNLGWAALLLVLAVGVLRWKRDWTAPAVIAGIGLAQMTLEVVILFTFQMLQGSLYVEVSLIVTFFMGGLALGGAASNRLLVSQPSFPIGKAKQMLSLILLVITLYSSLFPLIITLDIPVPGLVFPVLALLAGALTGAAYPLAVTLVQDDPSQAAGRLYGADLAGGCLGALLSSVILVPVMGVSQTCVVIAMVGLAGWLALSLWRR